MKNFTRFAYGARALAVTVFMGTMAYKALKETGITDKVSHAVNNQIHKVRNRNLNDVLQRVEEPTIIERAAINTFKYNNYS